MPCFLGYSKGRRPDRPPDAPFNTLFSRFGRPETDGLVETDRPRGSLHEIINLSIVVDDQWIANIVCAGSQANVGMWSERFVERRIAAIQGGLKCRCQLCLVGDHLDLVDQLVDG